jgi:hypothetical protein
MSWAILDESNRVVSIVEQEQKPTNGVKIVPNSNCAINKVFNGWFFEGPKYTSYEFLSRLTPTERNDIRIAAQTDSNVADLLELAQAAQVIETDDPATINGMDYLVSIGIFTEARKLEILGI